MVLGVVGIIAIATLGGWLPGSEILDSFVRRVRDLGPLGWLLYALVYAACITLFVPASVLTLAAGAIYGLGLGVAIVVVGATLGASLSFLLARTFVRSRIENLVADNLRVLALDRAIAREGAKIVFLVRLAPAFPFTLSSYAFGLTGVSTIGYVIASVLGMIPGTFGYVYLGMAAAGAVSGGGVVHTVLNIGGALVVVAVTIFIARIANRAIREAGVEDGDAENLGPSEPPGE